MKTKAPPKCKFFTWLVLHNRCRSAHRRYKHNLQDNDRCNLCDQDSETMEHLLVQCSFGRDVWHRLLVPLGLQQQVPAATKFGFAEWWTTSRKRLAAIFRKAFDSFVVLVNWLIWKERNSKVFDRKAVMPWVLSESILTEGRFWGTAGFNVICGPVIAEGETSR